MTIKWRELLLVSSSSIVLAILLAAFFGFGVRLLTNAQHAVPGARKGKSEDIRKEILNRVFAYISFALAGVILLGYVYFILRSGDKTFVGQVNDLFGIEHK
jgi:small-conductance mechanosensitive channel